MLVNPFLEEFFPNMLHGVVVTSVQDLAPGHVEVHRVGLVPSVQPVQIPLQSLPAFQQIGTSAQLGIVAYPWAYWLLKDSQTQAQCWASATFKHGSLCTHLHNYNSDTFKLYFEFSQEQKFVFLAKVPASKWLGAYIPSTSMLSCLSWDLYNRAPCLALLWARIALSSPWLLQACVHLQGEYPVNLSWRTWI